MEKKQMRSPEPGSLNRRWQSTNEVEVQFLSQEVLQFVKYHKEPERKHQSVFTVSTTKF